MRAPILGEHGVEGHVEEVMRAAYPAMRQVTRLHRVGLRLAVYGVVETGTSVELALWHVVSPGTYTVPQVAAHAGFGEWGLSHAKALCGLPVVTNGHAADHTPPEVSLCPVCAVDL